MSKHGRTWADPIVLDSDSDGEGSEEENQYCVPTAVPFPTRDTARNPSQSSSVRSGHLHDGITRALSPETDLVKIDIKTEKLGGAKREKAIDGIIRDALDDMTERHAESCMFLLSDAQEGRAQARKALPSFMDATDPFAGMTSILGSHTDRTLRVEHPLGRHDTNEIDLFDLPVTLFKSGEERVPPYRHYTEIPRNLVVPESTRLEFTPYLRDEEPDGEQGQQEWQEDLKKMHSSSKDPLESRKKELAESVMPYIHDMMEKAGTSKNEVLASSSAPTAVSAATELFFTAFEHWFHAPLKDLIAHMPQWCNDAAVESPASSSPSKKPSNSTSYKQLSSYVELGCVICAVHDCQRHGEYATHSDDKGQHSHVYTGPTMTYQTMILRQEKIAASKKLKSSHQLEDASDRWCSLACFRNLSNADADAGGYNGKWNNEDTSRLQTMFAALSMEPQAACILSPILRKTCRAVHAYLRTSGMHPAKPVKRSVVGPDTRSLPSKWYDPKTRRIRADIDCSDYTRTLHAEDRPQPYGCLHPGLACAAAGNKCSCITSKVLCEPKLCACPQDCFMRFQGCACKSATPAAAGTATKDVCAHRHECPCRELNRECDPDLCINCCAARSAESDSKAARAGLCANVEIQRGHAKKLALGRSTVPGIGFGCFMLDAQAAKNEFIAEYVGEVITTDEAERRGAVYNEQGISFIFTLNQTHEIDATVYGNLTRFINHSISGANVAPRILLVNGEHRIGFFASRALRAGDELWFNYGPHFQEKIDLIETQVPTNDNNDDDDDDKIQIGIQLRTETAAAAIAAIKRKRSLQELGGHSSRPLEIIDDGDDDDDDDDADVYVYADADVSSDREGWSWSSTPATGDGKTSRPARAIKRPRKYTR